MTESPRVNVSRELYFAALSDAIDWEDSFLESHWSAHDGSGHIVIPHCSPASPCEAAAKADRLARRYRMAQAGLKRRASADA